MTAPARPFGPCEPWCTPEQVLACCRGLDDDTDLTYPIAFATDVLWALSGKQFTGLCEQTVHPTVCGSHRSDWWNHGAWRDEIGWHNLAGGCTDGCDLCGGASRIRFPSPLVSVEEVLVHGEIVDPSLYRIEAFKWLVRRPPGAWPCSSDIDAMEVAFTFGRAIPLAAQLAAAALACEIARLTCGGTGECELDDDVVAVVRDQISFQFADPETLFTDGRVGVALADMWLGAVNPKRISRRAAVFRADDPRRNRRVTG